MRRRQHTMIGVGWFFCVSSILLDLTLPLIAETSLPNFEPYPATQEQICWRHEEHGVRSLVVAPERLERGERCLIVYATPNGNTLEQTFGCRPSEGLDWHYDLQHVAAQTRWLRTLDTNKDYVVATVQPPQLSWPEFRRTTPDANAWIAALVRQLQQTVGATEVILACHSGGGSFIWGWMHAHEQLPDFVRGIILLDANYSFSLDDRHDHKFLEWLNRSQRHVLIVLAYDDREVKLNGKQVVGPDGGTFRATERMHTSFAATLPLSERQIGDFTLNTGLDGRLQLVVHRNPENKILHTALVGEMNGLAYAISQGISQSPVGLSGTRGYTAWIQEHPFRDPRISSARRDRLQPPRSLLLRPRAPSAETGSEFCARVASLTRQQREEEICRAILDGNVPEISRRLVAIEVANRVSSSNHKAIYFVTADYMAIGSDTDFVRMPVTPQTARKICQQVRCEMITTKISDDLYAAADRRLSPHPLTVDRDQVSAFVLHQQAIQSQLGQPELGVLVAGIKKDIVLSNRLEERPQRVAIYGWHHPDGRVIQPLYVGHVDWYVDYSHGFRLLDRRMTIDGQTWDVGDVYRHPELHPLLSREGAIDTNLYSK